MSDFSLWLIDDPVTQYSVHAGAARIGEIRWQSMHASVLHLGERRCWLVHEEAAAVAAADGSLLSRFLMKLRLDRTYSLREDDIELARARRNWKPGRKRDWIELRDASDPAVLKAIPRGLLGSHIDLERNGASAGAMAIIGAWRNGVSLRCPGLEPGQAVLLMLAVQRAWGNDPHVRFAQA